MAPLHVAAQTGRLDIVKLLIEKHYEMPDTMTNVC